MEHQFMLDKNIALFVVAEVSPHTKQFELEDPFFCCLSNYISDQKPFLGPKDTAAYCQQIGVANNRQR
uniref:Uncharacterized protein n=1 Tax=Romanomermis culicivorax TaxID=13658 RepID=A0A915HV62_ROMCU